MRFITQGYAFKLKILTKDLFMLRGSYKANQESRFIPYPFFVHVHIIGEIILYLLLI